MLNVCFASFDVLSATCFYYEQQFPFHSFIRLLVTSTQHACWLWQTLTQTSARVLIMSSGRTIVSDDDGAWSWLWECQADHDWHPHRQEHGHPPQLITGHPLTRWPHRPLSPRHTMSRCHHLHICFNQHTRSTSSRINISDMRDYKWFESIKVMYSGEVVFIFSSFLMIFLFSPIPIPQNFPCGVCPISWRTVFANINGLI